MDSNALSLVEAVKTPTRPMLENPSLMMRQTQHLSDTGEAVQAEGASECGSVEPQELVPIG